MDCENAARRAFRYSASNSGFCEIVVFKAGQIKMEVLFVKGREFQPQ